jgi:hypothetical protein
MPDIDLDNLDGCYLPYDPTSILIDGYFSLDELRAILADCERRDKDSDWEPW